MSIWNKHTIKHLLSYEKTGEFTQLVTSIFFVKKKEKTPHKCYTIIMTISRQKRKII